jgi:hypothetical protein
MRQIRKILRQKWALGLSHRAVAQSLKVGMGTISSVVARAQGAGLHWPQVQPLSDDVLESRLYGRPEVAGQRERPARTAEPTPGPVKWNSTRPPSRVVVTKW